MFFFPLFREDLFSLALPHATRLLETSCVEKITLCVIETMLVTLPLAQMNKARREVNRTNQVQTKINIMKGPQTSVIHLIPGSTYHWISSRMRYFKISFSWNIFQQQLIAEADIRWSFLWNLFWKFHKFQKKTLFKKAISAGCFSWKFTKFFERLFSETTHSFVFLHNLLC